GSTVNPFATGIASDVLSSCGIVANQGIVIGLGLVLLVTSYVVAVYFVMRYAKRVRGNARRSLMSAEETEAAREAYGDAAAEKSAYSEPTRKQKMVLWLFGLSFLVMIIGFVPWGKLGVNAFTAGESSHVETTHVAAADIAKQYSDDDLGTLRLSPKDAHGTLRTTVVDNGGWSAFLTGTPLGDWYFSESTTWFLLMAIVIGIAAGMDEHELVHTFLAGCGDMMCVVMIVGLSRGVAILMGDTGLSLFVLHHVSAALKGTSPVIFALGSYVLYFLLSILIPGTSSMATISMPIMGPLTQSLGFNPAIMINVFASASGVVNYFTPANGAIMGGLALSRVEYGTWLKFVGKVVLATAVVNVVVLAIAMVVL
ncbi:MAG: YfcC family protein, partial [Lactobacillus sp.]